MRRGWVKGWALFIGVIAVLAFSVRASAQAPATLVDKLASPAAEERRATVRQLAMLAPQAAKDTRGDVFKALQKLDEHALAALIEARGDPSFEVQTWAKDVLEALGRRTPGDAVQTTDDEVLIGVLRAYASIGDVDALPVVLSFVNSNRAHVRGAAREATLEYGEEALSKVRATYAALTGERLPEDTEVDQAARKLFSAYDHQRLRDVYADLDNALAKVKSGDLDGAIADLDNVLARQPMLDRRAEIAPAYVAYAEAIENVDRGRAADYLQRALRLDVERPRANRAQADLLVLQGEDRLSGGIRDTRPFEAALALDPTNLLARAALDRLRAEAASQRSRDGRLAALLALVGAVLLSIGAVAVYRTRA